VICIWGGGGGECAFLGNDRFLFRRYQIVGSPEIMN
jgi:hypothetical protein